MPSGLLAMVGGGTTGMADVGVVAPPPGGLQRTTMDKRPTYDIGPENARMFLIDGVGSTSLQGVNPFIIQKAIDGFVGKVEFAKKLAAGNLLVKVCSTSQAKTILKMTKLHCYDVTVSVHPGLNTCKGVITCRDLKSLDEKEIIEYMKDQGVVDAKFITRTVDGKRENSWSVILTFARSTVPDFVYVGYERVSCRVFIPLPLRCFKCQKFGHGSSRCQSLKEICGKCSLDHETKDCTVAVPKCVNCLQPHASFSRDCPKFKLEKEIVAYRAKERVDYLEAKKVVLRELGTTSTPNQSYAAAVVSRPAVSTCTVGCQTEVYWVSTTLPTTETPTPLPVSKPATVSCSSNTVSIPDSLENLAVSDSIVPTLSSIVAAPTQPLPKDSELNLLLNELTELNSAYPTVVPGGESSQEASLMDSLVQKTARGRSKSPEDNAAGERPSSLSPNGGRHKTSSPVSKKHKPSRKNHKPR